MVDPGPNEETLELSWSLGDEEKKIILDEHNKYRSQVSPPAMDMLKMSWDTELEAFAQAYAEKCIWDHNKERGRRGENLFAMAPTLDLEFAVEDWNGEEKYYNLTTSTCVPGQMCGHYTQVVWASTHRIGCGAKFCEKIDGIETEGMYLLVCNYYPPGNMKGRKPYKEGPSCSQCPEGRACVNSLCEPTVEETTPPSVTTKASPSPTTTATPKPTTTAKPEPTTPVSTTAKPPPTTMLPTTTTAKPPPTTTLPTTLKPPPTTTLPTTAKPSPTTTLPTTAKPKPTILAPITMTAKSKPATTLPTTTPAKPKPTTPTATTIMAKPKSTMPAPTTTTAKPKPTMLTTTMPKPTTTTTTTKPTPTTTTITAKPTPTTPKPTTTTITAKPTPTTPKPTTTTITAKSTPTTTNITAKPTPTTPKPTTITITAKPTPTTPKPTTTTITAKPKPTTATVTSKPKPTITITTAKPAPTTPKPTTAVAKPTPTTPTSTTTPAKPTPATSTSAKPKLTTTAPAPTTTAKTQPKAATTTKLEPTETERANHTEATGLTLSFEPTLDLDYNVSPEVEVDTGDPLSPLTTEDPASLESMGTAFSPKSIPETNKGVKEDEKEKSAFSSPPPSLRQIVPEVKLGFNKAELITPSKSVVFSPEEPTFLHLTSSSKEKKGQSPAFQTSLSAGALDTEELETNSDQTSMDQPMAGAPSTCLGLSLFLLPSVILMGLLL
ncbi:peptidase inhibitor 16 isoform X2 [Balearica regulorum gibbericeps]|uniref:peptidase inhibitor 16 isoform X2 n=1 Tax=Balearica regulorum gibbericeps TaxID=100784 RepID=UPI003F609ABC